MTHTYSIYRDSAAHNQAWTGHAIDTYHVRCSCGVESGASHLTVESAHREPIHAHAVNSNRRIAIAVFDGQIIDRY